MVDFKNFVILLVDDEVELRNTMAFDFKRKGFTVLCADNGVNAFEIVKANKIDLVISDLRMPGSDGLDLLAQIRAHDPNLPNVIFVTGFADITESECIAMGAKKVLTKPFERKVLMENVLEVLKKNNHSTHVVKAE